MTQLWSIAGDVLKPLAARSLDNEARLQNWIERDIAMLDSSLMVIGREVSTSHGGRIDLLAVNVEGSLSIIELKRDRTPRDIVAQVLDYASWVARIDTPAVHAIADAYWRSRNTTFVAEFERRFDQAVPEPLNASHSMVIVASALDAASQRIVEYLSQTHGVGINTAFFTVFADGESQFLSANWLMDQSDVVERTERRVRAPWSGVWYVNAGEGPHRSWEDMRRFGFIAAGHGRKYSGQLDRLSIGDQVYVYQKNAGYVGYGVVKSSAVMAGSALIGDKPLLQQELQNPNLGDQGNDPEMAEYIVAVDWLTTLPLADAQTFTGIFANQNVVCRLRDTKTLEFLSRQLVPDPVSNEGA